MARFLYHSINGGSISVFIKLKSKKFLRLLNYAMAMNMKTLEMALRLAQLGEEIERVETVFLKLSSQKVQGLF